MKSLIQIECTDELPASVNSVSVPNKFFENIWLTSKQAANYLQISVKSLFNLTSSGKIPYYKLDRRNRYLLAELNQLLLAERRGI